MLATRLPLLRCDLKRFVRREQCIVKKYRFLRLHYVRWFRYRKATPPDICRDKRFMQRAINAGISNQILATIIKSRVRGRKHVSASDIDKFEISYMRTTLYCRDRSLATYYCNRRNLFPTNILHKKSYYSSK